MTIPTDAASIARGKYLAEKVAVCTECHGADFGGKVVEDNVAMGRLVAVNLTRGRGGLPADYADQDFVRALTHGVKRDGRSVIFMPTVDYMFTAEDLGAIVAYVKSMPPSTGRCRRCRSARSRGRWGCSSISPSPRPRGSITASRGWRRGPTPRTRSRPAIPGVERRLPRRHGAELTGGCGPPPGGANITPVGIGGWSERDFVVALRTHRRPNGSAIDEVMPRAYGECPTRTSPGSTRICGRCRPPAP